MGYLVQRRFKNGFKDVRISDLTYFNNLDDILESLDAEEFWWDRVLSEFYFEAPEIAEAYAEELNAEFGKGFFEACEDRVYDYKTKTYIDCYSTTTQLPVVKVWELVEGEYLSKGRTMYLTSQGALDKNQVSNIIKNINREFEPYNIFSEEKHDWKTFYNTCIAPRYSD